MSVAGRPWARSWRIGDRQEVQDEVALELDYDPELGNANADGVAPFPLGARLRRPALTATGLFGAAIFTLALLALVLNLTLPWLVTGFSAADETTGSVFEEDLTVHKRGDLKEESTSPYHQRNLDWPIAVFIVALVIGPMLVLSDLATGLLVGVHQLLQTMLLSLVAFFGFLLTLTGMRWLGALFARQLSESTFSTGGSEITTVYRLHAVPYLNLLVGIMILSGALFLIRRHLDGFRDSFGIQPLADRNLRVLLLALGTTAGALLALPLLPLASLDFMGVARWGESVFAFWAQLTPEEMSEMHALGDAGKALGWMRAMIWVVLYLGIVAVVAATAHLFPPMRQVTSILRHVFVLAGIPLAIAAVFLVRFYNHLSEDGFEEVVEVIPNPIPVLALTAILVFYLVAMGRHLLPYVQPHGTAARD